MTTSTAMTDDRRVDDGTIEGDRMGNFYLNDLEAASWGVSWEPDARRDETWLDDADEHPPDEEPGAVPEASDVRSMLMWFDVYGEDVRRLRRLFVGN